MTNIFHAFVLLFEKKNNHRLSIIFDTQFTWDEKSESQLFYIVQVKSHIEWVNERGLMLKTEKRDKIKPTQKSAR